MTRFYLEDQIINSRVKLNPEEDIAGFELSKFLEQSVPVLMGIFLFFNPFPHTTAIKEISFYSSVLIILTLIILQKKKFIYKTPLLQPFSLFILWAFIGIFFAINKKNSIHDFYSHLLRYIILYYILTNFFYSKKRLVFLSWIIIISASIFIAGGMFYDYLILGKKISSRFGLFPQASINVIGVISVFAFTLSLNNLLNEEHLFFKVFCPFLLSIFFIGLLLSKTRSAIIALFLSVAVLSFNKNKLGVAVLSLMLIAIAIAKSPDTTIIKQLIHRINISKGVNYISYEIIKEYPIFGIGFGLQTYGSLDLIKYKKRTPQKYQETAIIADPHNMVMDITVRLGVVGLAIFFYIIFVFFKMCWDIIKYGKDNFIKNWGYCLAAAFIAVSVIGLFQPIFSHMPEVVICTIFSMTTIVWRLSTLIEPKTIMPDIINVHQAKTQFSRLLKRAHEGEEIILAKAGKPYAKLVPLEQSKERVPGISVGKVDDAFFDPLPEDELKKWK